MRAITAGLLAATLLLPGLASLAPASAESPPPPLEVVGEALVQAERAAPRVCLTLNDVIAASQAAPLDSYVDSSPDARLSVRADRERLCVEGLRHGQDYRLTVRAGLRGETRQATADQMVSVAVPNRAQSLRFASNGIVLPRVDAAGLPVETVNLDRIRMLVLQVSDRDVIEQVRTGEIGERISYGTVGRVASRIGRSIWTGEVDIDNRPNAAVRTAVPMQDIIPADRPGVYLAVAEHAGGDPENTYWATAQWFVVSDIGLSAIRAADGLTVLARSVATAGPLADIQLRLVAQGGQVLQTVRTDGDGVGRFDAGWLRGEDAERPRALYADGEGGDFVFLDLESGPVDLSGLGLDGRQAPGAMDAFVATERGIYRPGETVQLTALLRSDRSRAVAGMPLHLSVRRQDGVEVWNRVLTDAGAGGYATGLALPANAMTGRWNASVGIGRDGPALGTVGFMVEDFVPPRLELSLDAARDGDAVRIATRADYLYGAPGGDLPGEAGLLIRPSSQPAADFAGYRFGMAEETPPEPVQRDMVRFMTGADGGAQALLPLGELPATTWPLEAIVRTSVFDTGGRPVSLAMRVPLGNLALMPGIRPGFPDGHIAEGAAASFDIVALDRQGRPLAREMDVRIVREEVEYVWYQRYGNWDYEVVRSDAESVLDLTVATTVERPATVSHGFDQWGRYRIEVADRESGAAASYRFSAGWWGAGPEDSDPAPETVALALPPGPYRAGDSVDLRIEPPFDAGVQVTIADASVRGTQSARIPATGGTVRVRLPEAGPSGIWLLVNAFGAPDGIRTRAPRRAIGAIRVPYDPAPATLDIAIDAPAEALPGTRVPVTLSMGKDAAGQDTFVTLAAVDDGVLQLTGFGAPDPVRHFLGARRPGIALFDLYGRFIDAAGSAPGRVRSGGDAAALSGSAQLASLPGKSEPVVALFSGIVAVDSDGTARIPLDLPDFDGRLRLMAQAWNPQRVGKATASLTVRRPMIASLALPRFLAPGDSAQITARLRNLSAPSGVWTATISADGVLAVDAGPLSAGLEPGQTATLAARLSATAPGTGSVTLRVTGPDGTSFERRRSLDVRSGFPTLTRRYLSEIPPGGMLVADPSLADGLHPDSARITVGINPLPDFDLPGMLLALDRYPYGCAEQTASRALPLLALPDLMDSLGIRVPDRSREGVDAAIGRLVAMQSPDGGFGLWRAGDHATPWLSAYVTDFLTRARDAGHDVPDAAHEAALLYMNATFGAVGTGGPDEINAAAYAAAVLAAAGRIDAGAVRRMADFGFPRTGSTLARAQMAQALNLVGDTAGADRLFAEIGEARETDGWRAGDYGSALRDEAGVLALMAESGRVAWTTLTARAASIARSVARNDWISTQERGWIVRAANALTRHPGPGVHIAADEATIELAAGQPWYRSVPATTPQVLPAIRNDSAGTLYGVVSVTGTPASAPEPAREGFFISRRLVGRDGQPLDPATLRQNDVVVVILEGARLDAADAQALVVDWLPAGLEAENAALGGESADGFPWLGPLSPTVHEERRDDRFIAAINLDGAGRQSPGSTFRTAYAARAVTPGRFSWPGAWIEDMYRPEGHAVAAATEVTIAPR